MRVVVESTGSDPFQVVLSQQFTRTRFGLEFFASDTVFASISHDRSVLIFQPPAIAVEVTNYEPGSIVRLRVFLDDEPHHDASQVLAAGGVLNFSYHYYEP